MDRGGEFPRRTAPAKLWVTEKRTSPPAEARRTILSHSALDVLLRLLLLMMMMMM
jgi:hypothetical protein